MSSRRLWLVRHPRPLVAAGLCYGASDVPADPAHLAERLPLLCAQLPAQARWHVSPLARARVLADALQLRLRLPQAPCVDARLAEMDFGQWEMQAWDAIAAAELQAWSDDFAHHRCGGQGESVQQFLQRVSAAWRQTVQQAEGDVVWVTHAGVIRALQLLRQQPQGPWAGLQAAHWPRDALPFGGVTVWPI